MARRIRPRAGAGLLLGDPLTGGRLRHADAVQIGHEGVPVAACGPRDRSLALRRAPSRTLV